MGFEWRIISSSFKEQWDSSETEILLQIDTMKNTWLPFPWTPKGLSSQEGKNTSRCHPAPSCLLWGQSSKRMYPRIGAPSFFCPVFTYEMEILPWGWHHWEYGGPEYPCCCLWGQGSHVKGGKQNIWDHCHHSLSTQFQKRAGRCYSDVCKYSCPKHTAKDQRCALGEVVQIPP